MGAADAATDVLVSELEKKIPSLVNTSDLQGPLILKLAETVSDSSWKAVADACNNFKKVRLNQKVVDHR